MKYLKLNKGLYLVESSGVESSRKTATTAQIEANNHIWLFDRSGSMSGVIRELVEDMITSLASLSTGDTLTVGWFSGTGSRDFILKGMTITSAESRQKIAAILRKYASTVGATCFSEILEQTDQVISDLAILNPDFSLVFFTDGCPVVPNYNAEVEAIRKAIAKIQGNLKSALLVGYGNYYDRVMLGNMAGWFGGSMTHASNLGEYRESLTEFITESRENGRRVTVNVPTTFGNPGWAFSINEKSVVKMAIENQSIAFVPPRKGKGYFYVVTNDEPAANSDVEDFDPKNARHLRAAYAAALIWNQSAKTDKALDFLAATGDVALIDDANNAFTNDEHGRFETKIRAAIKSPKGRHLKGLDVNHQPARDAYCLLDVLDLLNSADGVKLALGHKSFSYARIGTASSDAANTPKFVRDPNPIIPIDTLTWNDVKLNLSITCRIPGTVELDDQAEKLGFAKKYPTFIWRSYAVVKDGACNVPVLPMVVPEKVFSELKSRGLIDEETWTADAVVCLHLDRVPVMNRAIADGNTSAKNLSKLLLEELRLEFKNKAIKKAIEKMVAAGAQKIEKTVFTPAQKEYLAKFGIGYNGFSVPQVDLPPTDQYEATEFAVKIEKFSSIPSPEDVLEKKKLIEGGDKKKKLTPSELLMESVLDEISRKGTISINNAQAWFDESWAKTKAIRKKIQRVKFSIILGKRWFDEFNSREDCKIEVDGYTLNFNIRNVTVQI